MRTIKRMIILKALFVLLFVLANGCSSLNILKDQNDAKKYLNINENESIGANDIVVRIWYVNVERNKHFVDEIFIGSENTKITHYEYGKKRAFNLFIHNYKRCKLSIPNEFQRNELATHINNVYINDDSIQIRNIDKDEILTTGNVTYILVYVYKNGKFINSSCRFGIDCKKNVLKLVEFLRSNFW